MRANRINAIIFFVVICSGDPNLSMDYVIFKR